MTFDSHSLERLKKLGRELPSEIPSSQSTEYKNSKEPKKQKLHRVEIEDNPEQLFRELIEISPDGNIPAHLLNRLKQIEIASKNSPNNLEQVNNNNPTKSSTENSLNPYTEFKQLLLEDEVS
tara:strand:- start:4162 stop:4527 length:366 start_codon:yes stop_codon:yes gene_type:complete